MTGYEVEHNIKHSKPEAAPPRRPDLSTFFTTLDLVDTSGDRRPQNENSLPFPGDVAAAYRTFANALSMMRGGDGGQESEHSNDLLEMMMHSLMESADAPPKEVNGVSDTFLMDLDRVPRKSLKEGDTCPICANPYLDDPHCLVVRLPCHKDHMFDLECITPWLKLNATCPMDRKSFLKKKAPPPPPDEEDGEYDEMFA